MFSSRVSLMNLTVESLSLIMFFQLWVFYMISEIKGVSLITLKLLVSHVILNAAVQHKGKRKCSEVDAGARETVCVWIVNRGRGVWILQLKVGSLYLFSSDWFVVWNRRLLNCSSLCISVDVTDKGSRWACCTEINNLQVRYTSCYLQPWCETFL